MIWQTIDQAWLGSHVARSLQRLADAEGQNVAPASSVALRTDKAVDNVTRLWIHAEQQVAKARYLRRDRGSAMDWQQYRDAAARCVELAARTNDLNTRTELLLLAEKWHQLASDDDRFLRAVLGAPVNIGSEVTQFMYVVADGFSKRVPWLKASDSLREASLIVRAALEYGLRQQHKHG